MALVGADVLLVETGEILVSVGWEVPSAARESPACPTCLQGQAVPHDGLARHHLDFVEMPVLTDCAGCVSSPCSRTICIVLGWHQEDG
jgi:hypothetical protein